MQSHGTNLKDIISNVSQSFTYGFRQVDQALRQIGDGTQLDEEQFRQKIKNIQQTSDQINSSGKSDIPIDSLDRSRFNPGLMKNNILCPAEFELMKYVRPAQYKTMKRSMNREKKNSE